MGSNQQTCSREAREWQREQHLLTGGIGGVLPSGVVRIPWQVLSTTLVFAVLGPELYSGVFEQVYSC